MKIPKTTRTTFVLIRVLLLAGCSITPAPVSRPELGRPPDVPLIFVPGVLGSKLEERDTGHSMWGKGHDVIWPRDSGYEIAFPITEQDWSDPMVWLRDDQVALDQARAPKVVDSIRFLTWRRVVYERIESLFERHGYRAGNQKAPEPKESLFLFAYDFRRDSVAVALDLHRFLEQLRQARGEETLEVDLLCQSNGAHLCRYLSKYGGLTLEEAIDAPGESLKSIRVRRMALVGTANGGALRILEELHRGRRYLPAALFGRHITPETLFSFRSIFAELPAHNAVATEFFLDEMGTPLALDLYDPQTWVDYGWSAFRRKAQQRLGRPKATLVFGNEDRRFVYLRAQLERAKRLQSALMREVLGYEVDEILSIQNQSLETPRRAVIRESERGWELVFSADRAARRLPASVKAKLEEDGDGHATIESQGHLSDQEKAVLLGPYEVGGSHYGTIQESRTHERLLEFFLRASRSDAHGKTRSCVPRRALQPPH